MTHPLFDGSAAGGVGAGTVPAHPAGTLRPAPLPGQDTREICREILGFDDTDTERLIADGVLFTTTDKARA